MRRLLVAGVLLVAVLVIAVPEAAAGELALRGFVREGSSRSPISGATVTVSGAQSRADQVTDDRGFFRLSLPGTAPGGFVRLRVQKDGYSVYDQNVVTSDEIPLEIALVPVKPDNAGVRSRATPPLSETGLLLLQLKSNDPEARVAALVAFKDRGVQDLATVEALTRALSDGDDRVRLAALEAVQKLKPRSVAVMARVVHLVHDPAPAVVGKAAVVLGALGGGVGARSSAARSELLVAVQRDWKGHSEVRRGLVGALLTLGEHRDPRLLSALVDVVLEPEDGVLHMNQEIVAGFAQHPTLVSSRVPSLVARVRASTDSFKDARRLKGLISLLWLSGAAGREALAGHTSRLEGPERGRFALLWITSVPSARPEILAVFPAVELAGTIGPLLDGDDRGGGWCERLVLTQLDRDGSRRMPACQATLAGMATLTLGLEPAGKAWRVFEDSLRAPRPDPAVDPDGGGGFDRAHLALDALTTFPPETVRHAFAVAIEVLGGCSPADSGRRSSAILCTDERLQRVLGARLAARGDTTTVALLAPLTGHPLESVRQLARGATTGIRAHLGSAVAPE